MWIATDLKGSIVALVNPTRGRSNLQYQLKVAGLLGRGDKLEGIGYTRRILARNGQPKFVVVKAPRNFSGVLTAAEAKGLLVAGMVVQAIDAPAPRATAQAATAREAVGAFARNWDAIDWRQ